MLGQEFSTSLWSFRHQQHRSVHILRIVWTFLRSRRKKSQEVCIRRESYILHEWLIVQDHTLLYWLQNPTNTASILVCMFGDYLSLAENCSSFNVMSCKLINNYLPTFTYYCIVHTRLIQWYKWYQLIILLVICEIHFTSLLQAYLKCDTNKKWVGCQ
mgnify:CR=1 FL=1